MEINLHPDLERYIRELVDAGGYAGPDEVITEGLFLLWLRDQSAGEAGSIGGSPSPYLPENAFA